MLESIAAIAGVISAIIAILQFVRIKRKNSSLQKQVDLIASTGVALGYYYNFIVSIFSKLRETKLRIEVYENDAEIPTKIEEFDIENVELNIILPNDLQIESMNYAIRKMRSYKKGNIISKGSERNFGINFMYLSNDKIAILDFPKPLNAVREHMIADPRFANLLENNGKFGNKGVFNSDEWKKQEQIELENFVATIKILMDRGRLDEGQTETNFINVDDIPNPE